MNAALTAAKAELKRAWPLALALALGLGAVLVVGANLSNAFPSADRPFGWPGPSTFENGVAMVRTELVLATTLPALLMGVRALHGRDPMRDGPSTLVAIFTIDAMLLFLGAMLAATIGKLGAFNTTSLAFVAFTVAHTLLAIAFFAIGFMAAAFTRRHAAAIGASVWVIFVALWENATRWILFRQEGYDKLSTGQFPTWYFVSQAFSPLSLYRGTLILWDRKFMDYLEKAALGKAALPDWVNPATFAFATVAMWVAIPLCIACLAWWWQGRAVRRATVRAAEAA
jgi:hypothetical protein